MHDFDAETYQAQLEQQLAPQLAAADDAALVAVVTDLVAQLQQRLDACLDVEDYRRIACAPGCGACCVVNVTVLRPEALAIAAWLRANRDSAALAELRRRMDAFIIAISGLDDDERIAIRRDCVFLDAGGSCSIYPVRPLLCRSITSTDADACRDALVLPALGEHPMVMMNLVQKKLYDSAFRALGNVLQRYGWPGKGHELTAAVREFL